MGKLVARNTSHMDFMGYNSWFVRIFIAWFIKIPFITIGSIIPYIPQTLEWHSIEYWLTNGGSLQRPYERIPIERGTLS